MGVVPGQVREQRGGPPAGHSMNAQAWQPATGGCVADFLAGSGTPVPTFLPPPKGEPGRGKGEGQGGGSRGKDRAGKAASSQAGRDTERERQAQGCDPGRPPGISQASSLGTQQGRAGLRPQAPHTGAGAPICSGPTSLQRRADQSVCRAGVGQGLPGDVRSDGSERVRILLWNIKLHRQEGYTCVN